MFVVFGGWLRRVLLLCLVGFAVGVGVCCLSGTLCVLFVSVAFGAWLG